MFLHQTLHDELVHFRADLLHSPPVVAAKHGKIFQMCIVKGTAERDDTFGNNTNYTKFVHFCGQPTGLPRHKNYQRTF